jgi:hypothetical protein
MYSIFVEKSLCFLGLAVVKGVPNFARLMIVSRASGVAGLGGDKRRSYYVTLPQGFCITFSLLQTDLVYDVGVTTKLSNLCPLSVRGEEAGTSYQSLAV